MARFYDDANDLIQNQRALAELVGIINERYDLDENVANEITTRLNKLKEDVDKFIADCNANTETHAATTKSRLDELNNQLTAALNKLHEIAEKYVVLDPDEAGIYTIEMFVTIASSVQTEILGYTADDGVTHVPGLKEKVAALEKKVPSIVIFEENDPRLTDPMFVREDNVLYGVITDQVRNIETGANLRISPFLQGVVRDVGEGVMGNGGNNGGFASPEGSSGGTTSAS
mgnify:FL=1